MKAQEEVQLYRTIGDTDPIKLGPVGVTDDGVNTPVPDVAVVELHLATTPATSITGTLDGSKAVNSGYRLFAVTAIASVTTKKLKFEVEVLDGGVEYTVARGILNQTDQIL